MALHSEGKASGFKIIRLLRPLKGGERNASRFTKADSRVLRGYSISGNAVHKLEESENAEEKEK